MHHVAILNKGGSHIQDPVTDLTASFHAEIVLATVAAFQGRVLTYAVILQ